MRINGDYLDSIVGFKDERNVYERAIDSMGQERVRCWTNEMVAPGRAGIGEAGWIAFCDRATDLSNAQSLDLFDILCGGDAVPQSTLQLFVTFLSALFSREAFAFWCT